MVYQARVKFLALKQEVDRKRRAGYSVRAIYGELKDGGHLRICYSAFCGYIRCSSPYLPAWEESAYDRLH